MSVLVAALLTCLAAGRAAAVYQPGSPGLVWTEEEVRVVRLKVREMVDMENWRGVRGERWSGTVPRADSGLFLREVPAGFIKSGNKYCTEKGWGINDFGKMQLPTPSKLIRLMFHDCVPGLDGRGGCDGCLNWRNMGNIFNRRTKKDYRTGEDYEPVTEKGDNNGLQTVVAALELVYTNASWPSSAPALNTSLYQAGRSRADLWQFAGMVALEMEVERANFACDYDYNSGNQVRMLEGKEKCFFKLFKPSVFRFGRRDCVPDPAKKVTDLPYEATDEESHAKSYGGAKQVLDSLKTDFNMTAEEGISLFAVHALQGQQHNHRLPFQYMWIGNPHLTNVFFKQLAGVGIYRRDWGNGLRPYNPTSVGDSKGNPLMGNLWRFSCSGLWKSHLPEGSRAGPCFWKPTVGGCNRKDEERVKGCFDHFNEEGIPVVKTGKFDKNGLCKNVTYNDARVQLGGTPNVNTGTQGCGSDHTFALTFEVNFGQDIALDSEFTVAGCGQPDPDFKAKTGLNHKGVMTGILNCPPNPEVREDGRTVGAITRGLAEDHDTWNRAFMAGWEKIAENGYEEGDLVAGPSLAWLGGGHVEGSLAEAQYPLVFTDNKKLKPHRATFSTTNLRDACIRFGSIECPPEFRRDHEDYYISRLESPWNCSDPASSLVNIPVRLVNLKEGHVLTVDPATGQPGLTTTPTDADRWTYRPGCDSQQRSGMFGGEGGVDLTHLTTGTTLHLSFQTESKLLTGQAGIAYAMKKRAPPRRELEWADEARYLAGTRKPWDNYQWQIERAEN